MSAKTPIRTALVTGSGRNIGRAVVLALAEQGCNVIINGSSNRAACEAVAGEAQALGAKALVAMGDVGDPDAARQICRSGATEFGRIDILVNNAAVRPLKPFL
ncbi:MAG TPA: SDR family NAD(P)-dependent oxidoreductase, partial [Arenicellales bacterium]|nr:SDR family NAD(P)-dependent oxidoreductase [Arenicellales bacterium]